MSSHSADVAVGWLSVADLAVCQISEKSFLGQVNLSDSLDLPLGLLALW
jgi:hypothetical protein